MSDLQEKAMKMALEILETDQSQLHWQAVRTLRQALAQPEWVGLTEEEFSDLLYFDGRLDNVEVPLIADLVRAVQAKLKEKNT